MQIVIAFISGVLATLTVELIAAFVWVYLASQKL